MMNLYTDLLIQERDKLQRFLEDKQAALATAPEGHLWITHCRKHCQYFESSKKNIKRKYISVKQENYIRSLAQKEYDEKVCKILKKRILAIDTFLKSGSYEDIYALHAGFVDEKKKLMEPLELSDEEYALAWISKEYKSKAFHEDDVSCYFSSQGKRMRSKSEVIIADTLTSMGVPYRYECGLMLEDGRMIFPDFTILRMSDRKILYLEHLGMMDDMQYSLSAVDRINLYEKNGYFPGDKLFLTFESSRRPIDRRILKEMCNRFFL